MLKLNMIKRMKKRGISPVVATVLLIAIVVVIALIVFMWIRGMTSEAITKFDGTNVKLVCQQVTFEASYSSSSGYLSISNSGNVPIYQIKVERSGAGNKKTATITSDWSKYGMMPGDTYYGPLPSNLTSVVGNTLTLIPVLIGNSKSGEKSYTCDPTEGVQISI